MFRLVGQGHALPSGFSRRSCARLLQPPSLSPRRRFVRLVSAALFTLPLLAQSPERDRLLAAVALEHAQLFDDPAAAAYVNRICSQLTQLSDSPIDYTFKLLVAVDATEPMSLPGGYVFIPAAFFLSAQNEDEFATMLAHSVGHIELKQASKNLSHQQGTATIPLIFVGGSLHAQPRAPAWGMFPKFRSLQRENELEADSFGIELASRAGYNPAAFREYLRRTWSADFSTREARLAGLDVLLRRTPGAPPSQNHEFLRVQQAVRESLK